MGVVRKDANDPDPGAGLIKDSDPDSDEAEERSFESLVVLQFCEGVSTATVQWLLAKIEGSRFEGGAELLAKAVLNENGEECIVHVSASPERLMFAAETHELKKKYRDGTLREVTVSDVHGFPGTDDLETFFSMAEKQRLINQLLEGLRAAEVDNHVPGYPTHELYHGESIVPKLLNLGLLQCVFPLHDPEAMKRLAKNWYQVVNILKPQPIDEIHMYFGETIAMYFAFLGHYTMALLPSSLIGVLTLFIAPTDDVSLRMFFAVFNLIWATLFLEAWKRTSATLAYNWGTLNADKFEQARGAYYGHLGVNKVTGGMEPVYPKWKRRLKFYGVTVPLLVASLLFSTTLMLVYFHYQHRVDVYYAEDPESTYRYVLSIVPNITYSIIVVVLSLFYRHVARYLNDWENHRLQSAYETHLITKLVLFDFFNSFLCLFYIAFYMKNMTVLRQSVASLLLTSQVINQVMESLVPYLLYKRRKSAIQKQYQHQARPDSMDSHSNCRLLSGTTLDRNVREYGQVQANKDPYESTIEDYLEMFLQFGYVFMFSAAFPSAAVWALFNNITEIRSDAFKLCRIFQRPFSQPASGIGAWQGWFEGMTVLAVMTNCGLLMLTPSVQEYATVYGEVKLVLLFVLAEHLILAMKMFISFMIPDEPKWVRVAMKKVDYEARQAWISQRLEEAKMSGGRVQHKTCCSGGAQV